MQIAPFQVSEEEDNLYELTDLATEFTKFT
jgi:hypothetical protein